VSKIARGPEVVLTVHVSQTPHNLDNCGDNYEEETRAKATADQPALSDSIHKQV